MPSDKTNQSHAISGHSLNGGCGRGKLSKKIEDFKEELGDLMAGQ